MLVSRVVVAFPTLFVFIFIGGLSSNSVAKVQDVVSEEVANLKSPSVDIRIDAAKSLSKSNSPEATAALVGAMADPEEKVRRIAVKALREYGSIDTLQGLLVGLRDTEKSIRYESLIALLEIYVGSGNADLRGTFIGGALNWLPFIGGEEKQLEFNSRIPVDAPTVKGVSDRLQDEEASIRRQAAYTLGVLREKTSVHRLADALNDEDKEVQNEVVLTLGKIGTGQAGEVLLNAMSSVNKHLVDNVIDALGKIRYKPAASELITIYDSNDNDLGKRALIALSKMGAKEARGIFYYQMTSKNKKQRRWAVEGLGRLEDKGITLGLMKDFLREKDRSVQLAYCFALAKLGRTEFVDRVVLDLGNEDTRQQANEYAVELGSPLLEEFVLYLSDPEVNVRKELILVLMKIGDPTAIPHLRLLSEDSNNDVSESADRAIELLEREKSAMTAGTNMF